MDGENSGIVLIWGLFTLLADVLLQFQFIRTMTILTKKTAIYSST